MKGTWRWRSDWKVLYFSRSIHFFCLSQVVDKWLVNGLYQKTCSRVDIQRIIVCMYLYREIYIYIVYIYLYISLYICHTYIYISKHSQDQYAKGFIQHVFTSSQWRYPLRLHKVRSSHSLRGWALRASVDTGSAGSQSGNHVWPVVYGRLISWSLQTVAGIFGIAWDWDPPILSFLWPWLLLCLSVWVVPHSKHLTYSA